MCKFIIYLYFLLFIIYCFFFFFQAEDGIRDLYVTGVQTCALPIWPERSAAVSAATCSASAMFPPNKAKPPSPSATRRRAQSGATVPGKAGSRVRRRSEERRVGKECRSRWSPDQ